MVKTIFTLSLVFALCSTLPAWTQSLSMPSDPEFRFRDPNFSRAQFRNTEFVEKLFPGEGLLTETFQLGTLQTSQSGAFLITHSERFHGLERYELSPLSCALRGGALGAKLGLFLGALGLATDVFDENTAWYLTGAMATAGVLMGGAKADDPRYRVRWKWEDD